MSARIACGLSTEPDATVGAAEAAAAARVALGDAPADIAVVFACGTHLAAPEATLEGVHGALEPELLIGCGAGGVLGGGREIEDGTAVVVWAASLPDGEATTFHARAIETDEGFVVEGLPEAVHGRLEAGVPGDTAMILLPDPYSFPTDHVLRELHASAPEMPVLGGISSARTLDGTSALLEGDELVDGGAVGALLTGADVIPCVSQGAAPVGPELTITAAEGHVIHELAGLPALEKVREVVAELPARERLLLGAGLLVGVVIDGGKPDYGVGDFLVRGLLGADPDSGAVAVGAPVAPGQVIRLHARDAQSADRDLHESLALRVGALGSQPAGALVFTCNGRGRDMFGAPDHDADALARELGGAPAAGFFAAGEIGPVGGESFLHGFTATVAIFAE